MLFSDREAVRSMWGNGRRIATYFCASTAVALVALIALPSFAAAFEITSPTSPARYETRGVTPKDFTITADGPITSHAATSSPSRARTARFSTSRPYASS